MNNYDDCLNFYFNYKWNFCNIKLLLLLALLLWSTWLCLWLLPIFYYTYFYHKICCCKFYFNSNKMHLDYWCYFLYKHAYYHFKLNANIMTVVAVRALVIVCLNVRLTGMHYVRRFLIWVECFNYEMILQEELSDRKISDRMALC